MMIGDESGRKGTACVFMERQPGKDILEDVYSRNADAYEARQMKRCGKP
ncbi:MAG: hypothetical protein OEW04_06990 [Nitrospirota bacterium]|nr:hypothetical protein [Nitrospirota bacterium]